MKVNKNKVFYIFIISFFLDAYCFMQIGNRGITIWYLLTALLIFLSICAMKTVSRSIKQNPVVPIMIIYMIINYSMLGGNQITSLVVGITCWLFYLCSFRVCKISEFDKQVELFQKLMNIFCIYGIYQLIGNIFGLPLTSLRIPGIMVEGYNYGNYIQIAGVTLMRSNSIFREPSYFSQFAALNILIYINNVINGRLRIKEQNRYILRIILNILAILTSFSGSGMIIVIVGTLILVLKSNSKAVIYFIKKHIFLVATCLIIVITLLVVPNSITEYLLGRMSELDPSNLNSVSGYVRFIFPFKFAGDMVSKNPLLGIGIGEAVKFAGMYSVAGGRDLSNDIQPIIPRTLAEEGIVGFGLLMLFFYYVIKRRKANYSNNYYAILIGTLIMSFTHGTWSSEVYWTLLGFLNVSLVNDNVWR